MRGTGIWQTRENHRPLLSVLIPVLGLADQTVQTPLTLTLTLTHVTRDTFKSWKPTEAPS